MRRCIEILKINIVQSIDDNPFERLSKTEVVVDLLTRSDDVSLFVFVDIRSSSNAFFSSPIYLTLDASTDPSSDAQYQFKQSTYQKFKINTRKFCLKTK